MIYVSKLPLFKAHFQVQRCMRLALLREPGFWCVIWAKKGAKEAGELDAKRAIRQGAELAATI